MSIRTGQSISFRFTIRGADGERSNADETPTAQAYVNGDANAASVTISNSATGRYKAVLTAPTLAAGDLLEVEVTAIVDTVTDSAVLFRDSADVALDSSGRVLLQPTQTGVTIPTVTTVTGGVTTADLPTNFGVLVIDGDGLVNANVIETAGVLTELSDEPLDANVVSVNGDTGVADTLEANIGYLDAAVSSRLATAGYTAPLTAAEVWAYDLGDGLLAAMAVQGVPVPTEDNGDGTWTMTLADGSTATGTYTRGAAGVGPYTEVTPD